MKEDADFKYIVRIANTDIKGEYPLVYALTQIKGIGIRFSESLIKSMKFPRDARIGDLPDSTIDKIRKVIESGDMVKKLPPWMLNTRKEYYSSEDQHFLSIQLGLKTDEYIQRLKQIRSYRGVRLERGYKVRGQRTRSNGRHGLAVGVSRRRAR